MSCNCEGCTCGGGDTALRTDRAQVWTPPDSRKAEEVYSWSYRDPTEGWHACLKQKTRCIIRVHDLSKDAGFTGGEVFLFEATNSCHVEDADVCPRVTANSKSGEDYDLCGPPLHAEQEAAKLVSDYYGGGPLPGPSIAYLYGHTYLCQACQEALVWVGVHTHMITGQPA